ncbi:hypothetical protein LUZ61_004877 [Rhynchospora tenuis]|uniref:Uncharacterized protein n=1 Tax=Rhynchospora tenuis TaxID=198213 RepID=A0AAD6EU02_9POAL|nr:hypothetical protein LUZ61_004877 [Rhynchospora tenuis]
MELLLPCVIIFMSLFNHASCSQYDKPYSAIFSFGDSYADTGNFITVMKEKIAYDVFEHSPYGMTYFGQPTGRGSNGRLVIDFIAQDLGLPLLPPYFSQGQDFSKGANFAVIGAPALSIDYLRQQGISNFYPVDISLNVQLGWFQQLKPSLCNSTESCQDYFSKSLFVLGEIGGNDYNFVISSGKSISDAISFVPVVMDTIKAAAESLLKQGALHIVLPGNLPTGCIPILLTIFASTNKLDYDHLGCLTAYNSIGFYHNLKLKELVAQLQDSYPQAKIMYADYYEPVIKFLENPDNFGFSNDNQLVICCGGGGPYNFNFSANCGQPGGSACSDPSIRINWDGIHLTEAAFRVIATGWLKGPYAHPPILPGNKRK